MESGILYVVFNNWINDPETGVKPYKIGITRNSVEDRYYGLGLKMPGKFETLFAYKINDCAEVEYLLHNILTNNCVNGEWFKLNQEDINLIKNVCERKNGKLITEEIEKEIIKEKEIDVETLEKYENTNEYSFGNELELLPDKNTFRNKLLKIKSANWKIIYSDGSVKEGIWDARNMTEYSNIIGNIRSGYLRNWRKKGIVKVTFEVKDI